MHLFICNGTRQIQDFHYRIPGVKQPRQQKIAIGGQIRVSTPDGSDGLNQPEIDAILMQHRKYGIIAADEINKGRKQAPLAYRVDRHIKSEEIEMLVARNEGVLIEVGKETRRNAAQGAAHVIGKSAQESGTGAEFASAEMEITEVDKSGKAVSGGNDEAIIATPEGREPQQSRGNRRRR